MAGAGYKLFNTGDVLTAAQVNTYLQEQVVMVFANAAARTTALSGVLAEGMVSYLKDTDALEIYSGAAWVGYGSGDITGVTAGTGISGGGTSGTVTITNSMATEISAAGDIIVGTGSGTFDNLPIGTTGQVLTADTTVSPYKVKWATAATASSGLTFISRTSFSNVASQAFDNVFSSSYFNYLVVIDNIYAATDTDDLQIQFRYAGPSTETGATYYGCAINSKYNTTTVSNANTNGGTSFMLASETSNSVYLATGFFYVGLVGQSSQSPVINGIFYANNTGTSYHFSGGTTNARTYTGFLLKSSSSNITGAVTIYGLAKA